MQITEVRIKLMDDSDDRLQGFCSITFDDSFVVRDLKIIDGTSGPFVAMPSRKLTSHCGSCGSKNHLRANYCNNCGKRQSNDRVNRESDGRAKLYADIAHPINSICREMIQSRVIQEFQTELERAKDPSYVSRYDDEYGPDDFDETDAVNVVRSSEPAASRRGRNPVEANRDEQTRSTPDSESASGRSDANRADQSNAKTLRGPHRNKEGVASPPTQPANGGGDDFGAGIFE